MRPRWWTAAVVAACLGACARALASAPPGRPRAPEPAASRGSAAAAPRMAAAAAPMELFVRNVDYGATVEELRAAFEVIGPVESVSVPIDRLTGLGRGFAFVCLKGSSAEAAFEAAKVMDGVEFRGRALGVSPQPPRAAPMALRDAVALNKIVGRAETVSQLALIVDQSLGEFNEVNVATALVRLAGFDNHKSEAASKTFEALRSRAMAGIEAGGMKARALANVVWALSKLQATGQYDIEDTSIKRRRAAATGRRPTGTLDVLDAAADLFVDDAALRGDLLPQELANILWAYAKLGHRRDDLFLQLESAALELGRPLDGDVAFAGFKPQELSNLAWAFATARVPSESLFAGPFSEAVMLRVDEFNAQELANTAWAFAKQGFCSRTNPKLFAALGKAALATNFADFNAQNLSNMCWAFAASPNTRGEPSNAVASQRRAELPVFAAVFDALALRCFERVSTFTPQALATTAWAFSTTAHGSRHPGLFEAIAAEAVSRPHLFKAQDVSNTCWAFAARRQPDKAKARSSRSTKPSTSEAALFEAMALRSLEVVDDFSAQGLANTAWAMAASLSNGVSRDVQLSFGRRKAMTVIARAALQKLDDFEPQGLSNLCWAFAAAGVFEPRLFRAVGDRVVSECVSELKPQELSNLVWAFATARQASNNIPLFSAVAIAAEVSISDFKPQDLANVCWAFSAAGISSPRLFGAIADAARLKIGLRRTVLGRVFVVYLEPLERRGKSQRDGYVDDGYDGYADDPRQQHRDVFNSQMLANTAWAFAAAGVPAPRLFAAIADAVEAKVDDFNPQELANAAWAFATARHAAPKLFDAVAKRLPQQADVWVDAYGARERAQLYQVSLALKLDAPNCKLFGVLDGVSPELKAAFVSEARSPSRTQLQVSAALSRIGWAHDSEHFTEEGLSLDMAQPLTKLAVEFDGPWHYLVGPVEGFKTDFFKTPEPERRRLAGRSVAKQLLLRRFGWRVLHLPYFEWDALLSPAAQDDFLRQRLDALAANEPRPLKRADQTIM
ncbi:hypothetical protein M885DRAFT_472044 [Pelagophyceae sp. CCMP2097]|nr:hypothetical protein M885DRAFT_472044 [Pelagophyceae sp. CCMP2097]